MGAATDRGSTTSIRGFLHKVDTNLNFVDACSNYPESNLVRIDHSLTAVNVGDVTEDSQVYGLKTFAPLTFTDSDVPVKTGTMHDIDTTNLKILYDFPNECTVPDSVLTITD